MDLRSSVSRRKALLAAGYSLAIPSSILAIDWHEEVVKFKAKTLDGENFSTDSIHGKVVLVQFWATWCPYCRADAPVVDSLLLEFKDQGLEVLAVNIGESKKTITKFLADHPRDCKIVMMSDTNLAAWFGPKGYPYYAAINRSGTSVGEQSGAGGDRPLRRLLRQAGIQTVDSGSGGELHSSPKRS